MHMPVDAEDQGQPSSSIPIFALFFSEAPLPFGFVWMHSPDSFQDLPVPTSYGAGLQTCAMRPAFCVGVEYVNHDFHVCAVSTLHTGPFPESQV